jgi:hypothetical protein
LTDAFIALHSSSCSRVSTTLSAPLAARADAGHEEPVARPDPADVIAGLHDGAHGLVAQDPAGRHLRYVAGQDVQVGAADGGGVDPDDDVALVADLRVGDFFPGLLAGPWYTSARMAASSSLGS